MIHFDVNATPSVVQLEPPNKPEDIQTYLKEPQLRHWNKKQSTLNHFTCRKMYKPQWSHCDVHRDEKPPFGDVHLIAQG